MAVPPFLCHNRYIASSAKKWAASFNLAIGDELKGFQFTLMY